MSIRARVGTGLVYAGLVLAGCRADPAREVEREWTLQLTVTHPGDVAEARPGLRLQGTLVIDPRTQCARPTAPSFCASGKAERTGRGLRVR